MAVLESALRIDKGCALITEAGHYFGCTDVAICKAMLIYHHYQNVRKEYDSKFQLFATAAFNLSAQMCKEKCKLEEIVEYFKLLGTRGDPLTTLNAALLPAKVMEVQLDISRVVFNRRSRHSTSRAASVQPKCDLAHRFALAYFDEFSTIPEVPASKLSAMKTQCLKFLSTFYHCQKCISFSPLEIAWAAIYLSFWMYNVDIESIRVLKSELLKAVNREHFQTAVDDMAVVTYQGTKIFSFTPN